ncbi:MAG: glycerol-3-phosphate 1-O-acyltransferase PlsY [Deltaproteobacteria bacterium]|nr:glycerol-3-phosphate 1-O-acyltransferase PlsY [Deltaproteobacteria bacterium]
MNLGSIFFIYLIGAFPTGIIVSRLRGIDVTKSGSGNVGATNVARVLGFKFGLLVLFIDIMKGLIGTWLGRHFGLQEALGCLVSVLGHVVSLPYLLKGGKGVATFIGGLICVNFFYFVIFLVSFILFFLPSRIVSLSCLVSVWIVILFWFSSSYSFIPFVIACVITVAHTKNIIRLIQKKEPKFNL